MSESTPNAQAAKEKLWSEATAESWNLGVRVLLIVGVKGSYFDDANPRQGLLQKLERLIADEGLLALENEAKRSRRSSDLKLIAEDYNRRYLALFLEAYRPSELQLMAISSTGRVNPSKELAESVHA